MSTAMQHPHIATLLESLSAISAANSPGDIVALFREAMRRIYGECGFITLRTDGLARGEYQILSWQSASGEVILGGERTLATACDSPVRRGGVLGALLASGAPDLWTDHRAVEDEVLGAEGLCFHSAISAPVFEGGRATRWVVMYSEQPAYFELDDLEALIVRANLFMRLLDSFTTSVALREAHARIQEEVERIAAIQRALLPDELPRFEGVNVAVSYEASEKAGGDLYLFLPFGERFWGVLIADASGHGPSSATVMAMLHAIFSAYPKQPSGPGELLEFANRHLCAKRIENVFVTAAMVLVDGEAGRLVYSNAGHNPPIVIGEGAAVELDNAGQIPLGIDPNVDYPQAEVEITKGMRLVLYTDGITETTNADRTFFGRPRLLQLTAEIDGDPQAMVTDILTAVADYQGNQPTPDDRTLVVIGFG